MKKGTKKKAAKKEVTKKKTSKRKPVEAKKEKLTKRKPVEAKKEKLSKRKQKIKKVAKKVKKEKIVKIKISDRAAKSKPVKKETAKKKPEKQLKTAEITRKNPEFNEIEQVLLKQRAELLKLISKSSTSEKDISKLERGDLQDMAATSLEREMTFVMGSREREEFRMISNALKKIASKSYGKCEGCGERINMKRLRIVPFAQYCMDCKSSMEQEMEPDKEEFFK